MQIRAKANACWKASSTARPAKTINYTLSIARYCMLFITVQLTSR